MQMGVYEVSVCAAAATLWPGQSAAKPAAISRNRCLFVQQEQTVENVEERSGTRLTERDSDRRTPF